MPVVKITNSQLIQAKQVLERLSAKTQIPTGLRWAAVQAKKTVEPLIKDLGDHELALVREFAEIGPDGQIVQPTAPDGSKVPNGWVFRGFSSTQDLDASDLEGRKAAEAAFKDTVDTWRERQESLMGAENEINVAPRPLAEFEATDLSGDDLLNIWFLVKDE